jgi:hypothetical protein
VTGKWTRVKRLEVRDAPAGARVWLRCLSKRCRFKPRSVRVSSRGTARLTKFFRGRMRSKRVLEVRITAPNMIGKVVRYKMRRGRLPKVVRRCVAPGVKKVTKC